MTADFYSVLGVPRDAGEEEIRKAYKKKALKFHPDRNKAPDAKETFQRISEAFSVLSDKDKRAIYDKYGEDGLKAGGPPGGAPGGFSAGGAGGGVHLDPEQAEAIFRQFFGGGGGAGGPGGFRFSTGGGGGGPQVFSFGGGSSPMDEDSDGSDEGFGGSGFGGFGGLGGGLGGFASMFGGGPPSAGRRPQPSRKRAAPPAEVIQRPLRCTLEELANGFEKRLKVTSRRFGPDGQPRSEAQVLTVTGKPGWKAGTKVTFSGAGDQPAPGYPPQDIQFVVEQAPHPRFERDGDDLSTTVVVPLRDALCGTSVSIKGLNGNALSLQLDQITPETTRVVAGEGMPRKAGGRGNLKVHFKIDFPNTRSLGPAQRQQLRELLR